MAERPWGDEEEESGVERSDQDDRAWQTARGPVAIRIR